MYRTIQILILIQLLFVFGIWTVAAQNLKRKAWFGFIGNDKSGQLKIDSIVPNAGLDKAGLKKNDLLLSINNEPVSNMQDFTKIASQLYENDKTAISYLRDGKTIDTKINIPGKLKFQADWCEVLYGSLPVAGCTVRTIIYKPEKNSNAPGILFIPGYNCGSIENYFGNFNGRMIEAWVKKGYAVYTVEKSGLGDSYGCKACVEVDLQNDIEVFEAACNDMATKDFIDKNNLFIWGHSMGGIIAPLIAQHKNIKGIMVFGTVFRPWSEFLLEMHRVQKPLLDSLSFAQAEDFVRTIQKIYYEFFIGKKTPAQLYENPEYKKLVETELEYKPGKTEMWGRHWRFWQQLDSINLAKAWQDLDCKVLVLHGASDFIQCSAAEPYLVAAAVNASHPGNATMLTMPGLDHLMMNSKDFEEAARNTNTKAYTKGNYNPVLEKETIKWIESVRN